MGEFFKFIWLCFKMAFKHSKSIIDLCSFFLGLGLPLLFFIKPKWLTDGLEQKMNFLYFLVPMSVATVLVLARLLISPFWVWQERDRLAKKTEADLKSQLAENGCPLEIVFDPTNTLREFWGRTHRRDEDGKTTGEVFWDYRIKLNNNSKTKTLRNVRVSIKNIGQFPSIKEGIFYRNKSVAIDINPECYEMVTVLKWPIHVEAGMLAGESAKEYGPLEITASADDTKKTVKIFDFDYRYSPMIVEKTL